MVQQALVNGKISGLYTIVPKNAHQFLDSKIFLNPHETSKIPNGATIRAVFSHPPSSNAIASIQAMQSRMAPKAITLFRLINPFHLDRTDEGFGKLFRRRNRPIRLPNLEYFLDLRLLRLIL